MGASFHSCGDEPQFLFHAGLKEANDIVLYLKPLRILLEEMEQADFTAVRQLERVPLLAWQALGLCLRAARGCGLPGCDQAQVLGGGISSCPWSSPLLEPCGVGS